MLTYYSLVDLVVVSWLWIEFLKWNFYSLITGTEVFRWIVFSLIKIMHLGSTFDIGVVLYFYLTNNKYDEDDELKLF
ncbi:hypothetical protein GLOIN_2v1646678 [Rhizophagus irregularis DAOM 181602=DAOM 197198]|uniref:Uncharacterized protein n=1 Tax=Rhizophagus irregularis (strain DAOM 181602 / DAOM 197198 / MUCL 43194) TaxID=747089 RepID=A0A2P4PQ24_RHIID|nr:hypothetical protein GLOIN_2v1646678 [Rhizophagus irregularis DAOM 181602=DAOM 197198]POG67498.1 hypothetical protein GLOIN_2v1646678 [Rhizophagus irregularis DAOM 181602=DAOM 197198]GET65138.1 hypothetical protein GLOIN_2v1646678 [Rhizophagus irregularis DAOM 181602=DAOM 197198]|eukprot:XP_025174364.1 hypothetical protein GLOIN_2v1646678 [Rhizophagus irregularis DAOM 181602=DAOM 197198]